MIRNDYYLVNTLVNTMQLNEFSHDASDKGLGVTRFWGQAFINELSLQI